MKFYFASDPTNKKTERRHLSAGRQLIIYKLGTLYKYLKLSVFLLLNQVLSWICKLQKIYGYKWQNPQTAKFAEGPQI